MAKKANKERQDEDFVVIKIPRKKAEEMVQIIEKMLKETEPAPA